MIHELDPIAATFIAIGYIGFVVAYQLNVTASGRRSRAGQSMNYLQAVVVLCALTSYAIQFLPEYMQIIRQVEGWLLSIASLGLLASGCGVRLARAMQYEETLHKLDAALEEIDRLKGERPE